jgi:hypothetical protein
MTTTTTTATGPATARARCHQRDRAGESPGSAERRFGTANGSRMQPGAAGLRSGRAPPLVGPGRTVYRRDECRPGHVPDERSQQGRASLPATGRDRALWDLHGRGCDPDSGRRHGIRLADRPRSGSEPTGGAVGRLDDGPVAGGDPAAPAVDAQHGHLHVLPRRVAVPGKGRLAHSKTNGDLGRTHECLAVPVRRHALLQRRRRFGGTAQVRYVRDRLSVCSCGRQVSLAHRPSILLWYRQARGTARRWYSSGS